MIVAAHVSRSRVPHIPFNPVGAAPSFKQGRAATSARPFDRQENKMLRRSFLAVALACAGAGCATVQAHVPPASRLAGPLADIEVIDRNTGARLPIYTYQGRRYVAGTPGTRYAVAVRNRGGARVLAVVAVDGINAVSGESAAWHQTGYVLGAYQRYEVRGWRKSQERIAAFEFTALANSYAARTGRPDDVGVIGVALFREAVPPPVVPIAPAVPPAESSELRREAPASAAASARPDGAAALARSSDAEAAADRAQSKSEQRLGTGHGRSEGSPVTYTGFERAGPAPDQVIAIHYDSHANLVALGVIPPPVTRPPLPNPFPGSVGFVADPPR